jgi:hypothetical protein
MGNMIAKAVAHMLTKLERWLLVCGWSAVVVTLIASI